MGLLMVFYDKVHLAMEVPFGLEGVLGCLANHDFFSIYNDDLPTCCKLCHMHVWDITQQFNHVFYLEKWSHCSGLIGLFVGDEVATLLNANNVSYERLYKQCNVDNRWKQKSSKCYWIKKLIDPFHVHP